MRIRKLMAALRCACGGLAVVRLRGNRRAWGVVPVLLALAVVVACEGGGDNEAPTPPPAVSFDPLPAAFHRGMNIEPIGGYGAPIDLATLPASLDALIDLGVDHVALIPSFFQPRLGDPEIFWKGSRERIAADTRDAIRMAHQRGLQVLLKPHLWLQDRSDGAWRGDIDPDEKNWDRWQRAYRDAVLEYALLAAQENVTALSIGSELTALALRRPGFWRQLATDVRAVFPGIMTYAANWDGEFSEITWWDAVDAIGVDAFWPLATSQDEVLTLRACESRLAGVRDRLAAFARDSGRPVILTEIGYRSAAGAAYRPWEWHQRAQRADPQLQAMIYTCIGRVFGAPVPAGSIWLIGAYFWNWSTDPRWSGPRNSDFTPHGKPAEAVLTAWFSAR